jgi:hypothetical protein
MIQTLRYAVKIIIEHCDALAVEQVEKTDDRPPGQHRPDQLG